MEIQIPPKSCFSSNKLHGVTAKKTNTDVGPEDDKYYDSFLKR